MLDWNLFFTALGLAFVLEGIPYFLFAERLPKLLQSLAESPAALLRVFGGTAILFGLSVIFLCRFFAS